MKHLPRSLEYALLMVMRKYPKVYNDIKWDGQIAWTTVDEEI